MKAEKDLGMYSNFQYRSVEHEKENVLSDMSSTFNMRVLNMQKKKICLQICTQTFNFQYKSFEHFF